MEESISENDITLERSYGIFGADSHGSDFFPSQMDEFGKNAFIYYFKTYPSFHKIELSKTNKKINIDNAVKELKKLFDIKFNLSETQTDPEKNKDIYKNIIYLIGEKLIIVIFRMDNECFFYYSEDQYSSEYIHNVCYKLYNNNSIYKNIDRKNKIGFIVQNDGNLDVHYFKSSNKDNINLKKNYNDDLIKADKKIKEYIKADKNGLILFHGKPGCGKTYYLRYLMNNIQNKKIIYIPPNFTDIISNPEFINFAIEKLHDSILVIEDAESIIQKRQGGSSQAVSNILNLSDGLMSDVLKLKIICTFNSDFIEIDPALQRKGRLLLRHEFKPLNIEKANKLLKELGQDRTVDNPIPLSEIYNEDENNKKEEETNEARKIGFNRP